MSFDTDLAKFAEKLEVKLELVIKKIAFELFTRIVERTPVDEGIARASWQLTTNRISSRTATQGASAGAVLQSAMSGVNITGKEVIYITNSLHYIWELENGSSTQAPEGMVDVTLASVQAWIDSAIKGETGQ